MQTKMQLNLRFASVEIGAGISHFAMTTDVSANV